MIGDTRNQVSWFFQRNQIYLLRFLTLIAFVFFAYAVYKGLISSLWRDEAFTALLVQGNFSDVVNIMMLDTNTPLHPLLVFVVIQIFGQSDISMRSISLLAILGTAFLIRLLVKDKSKKELATIIFLTSVHTFYYATEARYYALFMFTTVLAFYYMLRLNKDFSRKNIVLFIIASILLMYSQTLGIIAFGANALLYLYLQYKSGHLTKTVFWRWFGVNLAAFLFFAPWILIIIRQLNTLQSTGFWLTFNPTTSLIENSLAFFYDRGNITDLGLLAFVGFAVYLIGFAKGVKTLFDQKKFLYLGAFLIPFVIIYFLSFKQPLFYIRYLIFLLPFLVIITAKGIGSYKPFGQFLAGILIIAASIVSFNHNYKGDIRSPFKEVAMQVREAGTANTVFINDQEYSYFQCEYYLTNCYIFKDFKDINGAVGLSLIPEQVTLNEEQVNHYIENGVFGNRLGFVFYGLGYPKYSFLEGYELVVEKRTSGNGDELSILIYEKR
jgi:4-amino-4-deoxy-L-arabinose transferase-like glycosyltransferase